MSLISLNLRPSEKQLREFAEVSLCMCNLIGTVLTVMGKITTTGLIIFCLSGVVIYLVSRLRAAFVRPIYQGLMLVSFPIGWVISLLVMGVFYYGILTAVGLVFRIMGRDPLHLSYDPDAKTYWSPYRAKRSDRDYFNQF